MAPTKQMQEALDQMAATGLPLQRWPGGLWSTAPAPVAAPGRTIPPPPGWSCTTATVRGLDARAYLVRARVYAEAWRDHRVLSVEGQALARPPKHDEVKVGIDRMQRVAANSYRRRP